MGAAATCKACPSAHATASPDAFPALHASFLGAAAADESRARRHPQQRGSKNANIVQYRAERANGALVDACRRVRRGEDNKQYCGTAQQRLQCRHRRVGDRGQRIEHAEAEHGAGNRDPRQRANAATEA